MAKKVAQETTPALSTPQPELRECSFMVPQELDGQDASGYHQQITFQVAARFGVCYSQLVVGAWRNDTRSEEGVAMVQIEGMLQITSAISDADRADFHDFALASARLFKQEAFYWRDPAGVSHIETVTTGRLN